MHKRAYYIGFTLFEAVISIGLLLIIVGSLGSFVLALQNSRAKLASIQEVDSNLTIALGVMSQRIRNAVTVNVVSSTFDVDPGVLSLQMANGSLNPTIFRLDQNDGMLLMQEGANPPVALTTNEVLIRNLVFTNASPAGEPKNIGIAITVDYRQSGNSYATFSHAATTSVTTRQ